MTGGINSLISNNQQDECDETASKNINLFWKKMSYTT